MVVGLPGYYVRIVCVCVFIYTEKQIYSAHILSIHNIYIYTYFQVFGIRVLLSNPNTLGPQKGHCLSCSWLPHTRFFESSLPTLFVRHCQLMLNWWFVARWFGILGSPKLKSPHEIRAIWMFLQKQLLWPTPKKKHRAPKPPIYDFIVDQDLTKKKMDTFIPEPLGSSLGRKADLKNYHQVESLKKKTIQVLRHLNIFTRSVHCLLQ